ncbi:MAG: hypothetical protein J7M14_05180 [Planctomycetes bacterium]|nr:hypothetical protein [Planctomycetota bacterium]
MAAEASQPPVEADFWDQIINMAALKGLPTRAEFMQALTTLGTLQCVLLLAVGVVYMLYGWKAFKVLFVANAAVIGALAGLIVAGALDGQNTQLLGAIAGGLLLAALALPLMKHVVGLMGAIGGAFVGYWLWGYIAAMRGIVATGGTPLQGQYAWAGAVIGMVAMGLLAFVIFRESIMFLTALQGSLFAISGMVALLLKSEVIKPKLMEHMVNNVHLLPVLILVPTVIGLVSQHSAATKKEKKKAKPAIA